MYGTEKGDKRREGREKHVGLQCREGDYKFTRYSGTHMGVRGRAVARV